VNSLRYDLENLRQERDLMALRFEKERRDLQLKADADFRKAQVSVYLAIEKSIGRGAE
jgi:mitotic spindle assembly checkpoint protein MAD1